MAVPASLPSPSQGVWFLGPVPVRAYALLIIVGIVVAIWIGNRRYVARGGAPGTITDLAIWAVPFGIIGGRLYHVITDWQLYFGPGGSGIIGALRIWDGGLGIWGAVTLGALGAWIGARRRHLPLPPVADAIAPGIAVAQAIGRWGNWFNQELFGAPTTVPWALEIDAVHRPAGYEAFSTSTPPSCTSRCGCSPSRGSSCGPTDASRWATAACSRSTSCCTAPGGCGSSCCASTPRTRSSGCG